MNQDGINYKSGDYIKRMSEEWGDDYSEYYIVTKFKNNYHYTISYVIDINTCDIEVNYKARSVFYGKCNKIDNLELFAILYGENT